MSSMWDGWECYRLVGKYPKTGSLAIHYFCARPNSYRLKPGGKYDSIYDVWFEELEIFWHDNKWTTNYDTCVQLGTGRFERSLGGWNHDATRLLGLYVTSGNCQDCACDLLYDNIIECSSSPKGYCCFNRMGLSRMSSAIETIRKKKHE